MDRRDARAVTPIALTIAGSDSGGGAGIQADLKTFAALGVYAATAITAVTAQNTLGVRAIHLVPVEIVAAQILAVTADFQVAAIKIGMLGSTGIVEAVAASCDTPTRLSEARLHRLRSRHVRLVRGYALGRRLCRGNSRRSSFPSSIA